MVKKTQQPKKIPIVKRFKAWNKLKFKLHFSKNCPIGYKDRDIWWVAIGHNVGVEEDGKGQMFNRPVLVVKGFSKYQFWGIPLSTTSKTGPYYHKFMVNGKVSTALLSQLRVYDTKRFICKYGMASVKDFATIKQMIISFLS